MTAPFETHRARWLYMLGLILAGEAVFALPFHIARLFRPTMLETFGLTPTELGFAQGAYGVIAMLAYFPGGPLADRFPAHKLMATSLWSTAVGGLYMASFPGYAGTIAVFAFFGLTTILLFWAALIRATRDWGGIDTQGRAYGILDGGRGLLAAALASVGVMVFGLAFPEGYGAASFDEKTGALRTVILGYAAFTAFIGAYVWFALDSHGRASPVARTPILEHIGTVIRMPAVLIQAGVVVCAYVGYKGLDNYSLFAVEVYGMDEIEAAQIVALGAWVRPIAAVGVGLLADRFSVTRMLLMCFVVLLVSDLYFAFADPVPGALWIILSNTVLACIAIYGLRGIYFALFEETRIPPLMTGTAVGLVSCIGYTPDIFVTLVAGILIDQYPGTAGHQYFFMFLASFAAVGALASIALSRLTRSVPATSPSPDSPSVSNA